MVDSLSLYLARLIIASSNSTKIIFPTELSSRIYFTASPSPPPRTNTAFFLEELNESEGYISISWYLYSSEVENWIDPSRYNLKSSALELYKLLNIGNKKIIVYRPVDRMILKVNNIYRMNIIIKTNSDYDNNGNILRTMIRNAFKRFKVKSNVKVAIDIDPLEVI